MRIPTIPGAQPSFGMAGPGRNRQVIEVYEKVAETLEGLESYSMQVRKDGITLQEGNPAVRRQIITRLRGLPGVSAHPTEPQKLLYRYKGKTLVISFTAE